MEKTHRLFLRNLPVTVTKNDIEDRFKNHGTIVTIDIKEKPNVLESGSKFAFVSINTTDRKLNTCFQELNNLIIKGCKIHMEVAKESFLARLQREREECNKVIPVPKLVEPKAVIEPLKISPKEIVYRPTKKTFDVDHEEVSKLKPKDIIKPMVHELKKVVQLSTAEQKKKNESEEKRLRSLMEKKMAFKMKGGMIREALNAMDQKPLGKKVIFSDNMDVVETGSGSSNKKQKRLFDDDDDDGDEISDNSEFKISGTTNKKLRALQSNFGNDKRFTLDERFVEDEDNIEEQNVEPSPGIHEERDWQLDILQNVLGKPLQPVRTVDTIDKRRKGMIRYDPMNTDHYEVSVRIQNPKKNNNLKKISVENDIDKDEPPKLSKDTFYNVSENLVDTLKQDEQFSLLKAFGTELTDQNNHLDKKPRERQGHLFNFGTNNPFKYDSSDNESHNGDKILDVQQNQAKNDWNDSLFFNINDVRFEDARKFFNKQRSENAEFSTRRRELKQIVRSKIQNNLRKKITWKKKKQQK